MPDVDQDSTMNTQTMNQQPVHDPVQDVEGNRDLEQAPNDEAPNVDHNARIRELAIQLRNASPSGANTISDKILYHLNALEDPEQYNRDIAKAKEAEDKREAEQKQRREALKAKAEPAKV